MWNLTKFQLIQTTHRKNGNKSFDFVAIKMWTKLTIFAFWTKIELNTNKSILYIKELSVDIFNISRYLLYYTTISIQWAIFKKKLWWRKFSDIQVFKSKDQHCTELTPDQFIFLNQTEDMVMFIYSEKATKFCEISTLILSYVVPVKSKVEISPSQNIWTLHCATHVRTIENVWLRLPS